MYTINKLRAVAEQFAIRGDITDIEQIKKGYINLTYKVDTISENGHIHQYILQRINTDVFPDMDALMSNFVLTTEHLSTSLQMPGQHRRGVVATFRPTKDGKQYFCDPTYELSYDNGNGYKFFGMSYADRIADVTGLSGIRYGRYRHQQMDPEMIAADSLPHQI